MNKKAKTYLMVAGVVAPALVANIAAGAISYNRNFKRLALLAGAIAGGFITAKILSKK